VADGQEVPPEAAARFTGEFMFFLAGAPSGLATSDQPIEDPHLIPPASLLPNAYVRPLACFQLSSNGASSPPRMTISTEKDGQRKIL
jgi:hypothetical protein